MRRLVKKVLQKMLRTLNEHSVYVNVATIESGNSLKGKTVFITGGGKGIGLSISKKCIREGAKIVISGRDRIALKKTAIELGDSCNYIEFDVNDIDSYDTVFSDIIKKIDSIDCLVLNAGISLHEKSFEDVTPDTFQKQINTNLKSNYFIAQTYVKKYAWNKGNILFVSSETADMCSELPYGLTKTAINSLVGALSRRYYKMGIRVNAVCPGVTLSNMVKSNREEGDMYCDNASGRFFYPEEVAEVVAFLLSDASTCISGETIHTNAGNHLRPQLTF